MDSGDIKDEWQKKQELRPLFSPHVNMTYIYGTPVCPEVEPTKYVPSIYFRNEKTFEPERVTPGLNLDP